MPNQINVLDQLDSLNATCSEMVALLQELQDWQDQSVLIPVEAILLSRTRWLLRRGSKQTLHEEALILFDFFESDQGEQFRLVSPETFGRWSAWAELISDAADSLDTSAVDALLLSYSSHGYALLDYLAQQSEAVPRGQIKEYLKLTNQSYLSHLLRDFENAHLIIRHSVGKQVMVELGVVGQDYVKRRISPPWLDIFLERLQKLQTQSLTTETESSDFVADLKSLGASETIANKIDVLLKSLSAKPPVPENKVVPIDKKLRMLQKLREDDPYFAGIPESTHNLSSLFSSQPTLKQA